MIDDALDKSQTTTSQAVTDLFRHEAIEAHRQKLYGVILLRPTWLSSMLVIFFAVCIALLLAFFFLTGFARKENLNGVVLPDLGLLQISATQSGTVDQLLVREGAWVKRGDLLLTISSDLNARRGDTTLRVDEALNDQLHSLQRQRLQVGDQEQLNQRSLARELANLNAELKRLEKQIDLQRQRSALSEDTEQRMRLLLDSKVVSQVMLNEKAAESLDQRLRLGQLERDHAALSAQRDVKQLQLRESLLQHARERAELDQRMAGINQSSAENDVRGQIQLRASESGRVTALAVNQGQVVGMGQPLLRIVPAGANLEVVLYAPTRAMGLLHIGMPVQIRYDAFPYQKYGQYPGKIREISSSPVLATEIMQWSADMTQSEPLYRIRVAVPRAALNIDGRTSVLQAGMHLQASVSLEYRKLYQWAFAPLAALRNSAPSN